MSIEDLTELFKNKTENDFYDMYSKFYYKQSLIKNIKNKCECIKKKINIVNILQKILSKNILDNINDFHNRNRNYIFIKNMEEKYYLNDSRIFLKNYLITIEISFFINNDIFYINKKINPSILSNFYKIIKIKINKNIMTIKYIVNTLKFSDFNDINYFNIKIKITNCECNFLPLNYKLYPFHGIENYRNFVGLFEKNMIFVNLNDFSLFYIDDSLNDQNTYKYFNIKNLNEYFYENSIINNFEKNFNRFLFLKN